MGIQYPRVLSVPGPLLTVQPSDVWFPFSSIYTTRSGASHGCIFALKVLYGKCSCLSDTVRRRIHRRGSLSSHSLSITPLRVFKAKAGVLSVQPRAFIRQVTQKVDQVTVEQQRALDSP